MSFNRKIRRFLSSLYTRVSKLMAKDKKPTDIGTSEGSEKQRMMNPDPLVYFASREQSILNNARNSGRENTVSHPSLNYNVWATWWTLPTTVSSSVLYQRQGIVELIRFPDSVIAVRDPADTLGLPTAMYTAYKDLCSRVPKGRRVFYDYYWQNPSYYKTYDDYYKTTSDATTYTGGVTGYGDPSPVKFLSPWGTNSTADTKTSFKKFLSLCKSQNILFDYFWDDTEGFSTFSLGGTYNTYESTFDANGLPNNYETWQSIPDPRRTPAIVSDSRFTSVLNQNGRTFSQEVVQKFRDLIGNPSDTRTAAQILSYYTTVTNRQDFNPPWGQSNDIRMAYYAFDAALYTYNFGTLRKSCIVDALTEASMSSVKVFQSDVAPLTVAEAKYATDYNSHYVPRDAISSFGASLHFFGQNNLFGSYGYTNNPTTDDQKYAIIAGGNPFISNAHMAFVMELRKMRGMMRSSSTAYENFVPVVTTPSNTFNATKFNQDPRYWYEMMYHLCLHGANYFNVYTEVHTEAEMDAVQTVLDNWKSISGNNKAIPASNESGSTSTAVERVNLEEAAERGIISGGYVAAKNKWIWRLTAPPGISNYVLTDTDQTDLPATITIPSNSRGVWIERKVAGKPSYSPSSVNYTVDNNEAKRMFADIGIGVNGGSVDWLSVTDTTVATFQGAPLTGTRAYAWEGNPSNPDVSSPWHNIIYEQTIDIFKWGGRAFMYYCPFGSFDQSFFLTPEIWRRTFTTYTGDNKTSPARWKGFKQAIKALLQGTLAPSGKDPINEPCNVMIYHPTNRGYYSYRTKSNALWDSLGSTNEQRDRVYYQYLDAWIDELISINSTTGNAGKLHITLDATSPSATPNTLSLFRTMPDYRSDLLELSDWYIFNRLSNAGIQVFIESRPAKSINRADVPDTGQGSVGSTANVEWAGKAFTAEEYWLWYSNPSNTDTNFDNHATDTGSDAIFRLLGSNFPLPLTNNRDRYGMTTVVYYQGARKTLVNPSLGTSYIYTPHFRLWSLHMLSDHYRKYYNIKTNTNTFKGVVCQAKNIVSYFPQILMNGQLCLSTYDGVHDPRMTYWRLPASVVDYRPMFDGSAFKNNPNNYYSGFWTQDGKDFWDSRGRKSSFSAFLTLLHDYSLSFGPSGSVDWDGDYYGTSNDQLAINTIVLIELVEPV